MHRVLVGGYRTPTSGVDVADTAVAGGRDGGRDLPGEVAAERPKREDPRGWPEPADLAQVIQIRALEQGGTDPGERVVGSLVHHDGLRYERRVDGRSGEVEAQRLSRRRHRTRTPVQPEAGKQ